MDGWSREYWLYECWCGLAVVERCLFRGVLGQKSMSMDGYEAIPGKPSNDG